MTEMTRRSLLAATAATVSACAVTPPALLQPAASPAGFSADSLAKIPPTLQQMIDVGGLPGVVTMAWRRGQLAQVNALGVRDIAGALPMERNTIFRIASMTKPVTVATALILMEQGKLRLDDPITRWAPEFANMRVLKTPAGPLDDTYSAPRAITIEDLMTHRAGFSYGMLSAGPIGAALNDALGMGVESAFSPDDWLKTLAAFPLLYPPGERFNYGHGIDVLGFILGRIAKSSLREVMRKQLFAPLNMADTDFWIPPAKRNRVATPYMSAALKSFEPVSLPGFIGPAPPAYTSGGQGLAATADDYLAFARMLMGGGEINGRRIMKTESIRMMTSNRLTPAQRAISTGMLGFMVNWKAQGFGLGVSVVEDAKAYETSGLGVGSPGSYGWPGAFGGWWQADPAEDLILIWLQQVLPAPPRPGAFAMPHFAGAGGLTHFRKLAYASLET